MASQSNNRVNVGLFNEHKDQIERKAAYKVYSGALPNHIEVEDAQQVALEALAKATKTYNPDRCDSFGAYANTMANFALLDLWKSNKGGRMLGGLYNVEDSHVESETHASVTYVQHKKMYSKSGVSYDVRLAAEPDSKRRYSTPPNGNMETDIEAAADYEVLIGMLPESLQELLESKVNAATLGAEAPRMASIKANLLAAMDVVDMSKQEVRELLQLAGTPGAATVLYDSVDAVYETLDRREAVMAASKIVKQNVLAFAFGIGKSAMSNYVAGRRACSPEMAAVCQLLVDGKINEQQLLAARFGIELKKKPKVRLTHEENMKNRPKRKYKSWKLVALEYRQAFGEDNIMTRLASRNQPSHS